MNTFDTETAHKEIENTFLHSDHSKYSSRSSLLATAGSFTSTSSPVIQNLQQTEGQNSFM